MSPQAPKAMQIRKPPAPFRFVRPLPVRLLVAGTGTGSAELLGLASSVVSNEKGAVVCDKGLLQLVLAVLIDILLVVGDDALGNGLSDGVDLRSVSTSANTDTDVVTEPSTAPSTL